MLENILYKLTLFHPTISNIISLTFLLLALLTKTAFIHSVRDLAYYWYVRPLCTFFVSAIFRVMFEYLYPQVYWDLSQNPFLVNVVILYIFTDFTIYVVHFLMHKNKYLFKVHKVHHQIEHLSWENGSKDTIWFEVVVVAIAVLFSYFLNISLLTTAVTVALWKAALAYTHSNPIYHFKWLNWIIISPEKHELHHTDSGRDDYNFSLTLTWWDYLYKVLRNKK